MLTLAYTTYVYTHILSYKLLYTHIYIGDSSEQDDYVEYLPEMYTFKTNSGTSNININSSNSNVFGRKMNNESNNRTNINKQIVDENQNDYDFDDTNSFINQADILNARIFDVSSTRCACPNCGDTLLLPLLSHEERLSVKSALMDLITERKSPKKLAYIQNFEKWLEENGPYKYIVDGANVGYNRQNCANGRFSYEQVIILCAFIYLL